MAVSTSINKVLGAIALTGVSGALTRITADILRPGDIGFVATNSIFYIYKAQESNAEPTPEPFSASNPPWILKPEDADETGSTFRWHLTSSAYFNNDVKIAIDKFLQANTIKGDSELTFYTGEDLKSAKVNFDGSFWVRRLTTDSTKLVENLNAEFIKGVHGDLVMTRDGKRAFFEPVSGVEPVLPDHLTTKNYVDEKINMINPDSLMRRDGSTAFTNPVAGLDPILPEHLSTKNYVDVKIAETLEEIETAQNYIIYKTGTREIPINTSKMTIVFGGVLKSYTVFTTMVNTKSSNPFSVTATIVKQTNTSFTVDFGGDIDESTYQLNWMIVGMPLQLEL